MKRKKSLEQKLSESKAKLEKLSITKLVVDDISSFVPLKPKADKVYIPPFKRNHKQKAYITRLEKSKSSDINTEVSKPMSKPSIRVHKKFVFVLIYIQLHVICCVKVQLYILLQKKIILN